ncbi:formylglycine-generating enzyme family protein, partial [bacterium]|nr:formylglycine-generating enzyme family protein [bacterium]
ASFMGKLRAKTGQAFDLPTEAQWEYAARAGATGPYAGTGVLGEMGWYNSNSGGQTHPSGRTAPNAWGLCDMHGNAWEWCLDWYGAYSGTVSDPRGAPSGSARVIRGGSWGDLDWRCRLAFRGNCAPGGGLNIIGFRIVLPAGQ